MVSLGSAAFSEKSTSSLSEASHSAICRRFQHMLPVSPAVPLIVDLLERPQQRPQPFPSSPIMLLVRGTRKASYRLSPRNSLTVLMDINLPVAALIQRMSAKAGPPNIPRVSPWDSVFDSRTSTKLSTSNSSSHLCGSCHSKHRPLDSWLRDADRLSILLFFPTLFTARFFSSNCIASMHDESNV